MFLIASTCNSAEHTQSGISPLFSPAGGDLIRVGSTRAEISPDRSQGNGRTLGPGAASEPGAGLGDRSAETGGKVTREWTDLPREPVFVPLVKVPFAYLAGSSDLVPLAGNLTPGETESREPGWYLLPDRPPQIVATDSSESIVAAAELNEVISALGLPANTAGGAASPSSDRKREFGVGADPAIRTEIGPWIALLLIVWFAGEGILATAPRVAK